MRARRCLAKRRGDRPQSATLHHAGVVTLPQFAALDVDVLARLLPSASVTRARLLQGLARKVMERNGEN